MAAVSHSHSRAAMPCVHSSTSPAGPSALRRRTPAPASGRPRLSLVARTSWFHGMAPDNRNSAEICAVRSGLEGEVALGGNKSGSAGEPVVTQGSRRVVQPVQMAGRDSKRGNRSSSGGAKGSARRGVSTGFPSRPSLMGLEVQLLMPPRTTGVVPKPAFLDRMWGLEPGLLTRLPSLDVPPELSRVLRHVAIACVSAYLYGYHLSIVNGPLDAMALDLGFAGNAVAKGSVVSSFLVGAFLGCTASSTVADGLGRRKAFLATGLPVLLGSSISALSSSLPLMVLGRVIVGFGLGLASPLPTMYISEIAPDAWRGTLNGLPPVAACIGILLALGAGVFFPDFSQGWRWCFWLGSLPAAALILLSPSLVESPRWLGQQGEWGAAERAVRSLQAPSAAGAAAGRQAMIDLRAGASSPGTPEVSLLGLFSNQYRKLLLTGCALFGLQQLTGISSVFFFSSSIFERAGVTSDVIASLAVGVANLAASVLSSVLVDKAGRKSLLLGSFGAMGVTLAIQAASGIVCSQIPSLAWIAPPVALACTIVYVMAFAMGAGPIPGLLLPEMYPTQIRAKGFAVCLSVYWVFNCVLGLAFLPLLEAVGSGVLNAFFALMCLAAALFTQAFIVETKGKSLEEIEAALLKR